MAEHLTSETFREKVYDFVSEKEWKYKGKLPGLIDFYADWCGPCKMIAPIIEELANTYKGKLNVWKVDTDVQSELAVEFGISSIPTLMFIPIDGKPQMKTGAMSKVDMVRTIKDQLGVS